MQENMGVDRPFFGPEEGAIRERLKNTRQRLVFGAVLLAPYREKHLDFHNQPYLKGSLMNIDGIAKRNYRHAIANDTLPGDTETRHKIFDTVRASLFLAQNERVEYHHRHYDDQMNLIRNNAVIAAEMGLATPEELLSIVIDNPEQESIELAKQSHPFRSDPDATRAMNDAMMNLLQKYQPQLVEGDWNMRTKRKGINPDIPSAIVVTKSLLGTIGLENGDKIEIIQRQGNFIRGDEAVSGLTDPPMDRLIKNPDRVLELLHLVDRTIYERQTPPWLISMTTSMYARRIRATEAA